MAKKVFFLTPQVMQNDLARGTCPTAHVCCVVFDEAHKALGNHAYCQVQQPWERGGVRDCTLNTLLSWCLSLPPLSRL